MIDSATIVSETQTPSQAPQSDNVLKCPVLSGPTDLPKEIDASPDIQTTCEQNPSRPNRTLTGHQPAQPPQLEPQPAHTFCKLIQRQPSLGLPGRRDRSRLRHKRALPPRSPFG